MNPNALSTQNISVITLRFDKSIETAEVPNIVAVKNNNDVEPPKMPEPLDDEQYKPPLPFP